MLVFRGHRTKLSQSRWLKITHVYYLALLEVRSVFEMRVWGCVPSGGCRTESLVLPFSASRGCPDSQPVLHLQTQQSHRVSSLLSDLLTPASSNSVISSCPLDNPGSPPWLKMLDASTFIKFLQPHKVTHSQVSGTLTWRSL